MRYTITTTTYKCPLCKRTVKTSQDNDSIGCLAVVFFPITIVYFIVKAIMRAGKNYTIAGEQIKTCQGCGAKVVIGSFGTHLLRPEEIKPDNVRVSGDPMQHQLHMQTPTLARTGAISVATVRDNHREKYTRMFRQPFASVIAEELIKLDGKDTILYSFNPRSINFTSFAFMIETKTIVPRYFASESSFGGSFAVCEWVFDGEREVRHINHSFIQVNFNDMDDHRKKLIEKVEKILRPQSKAEIAGNKSPNPIPTTTIRDDSEIIIARKKPREGDSDE